MDTPHDILLKVLRIDCAVRLSVVSLSSHCLRTRPEMTRVYVNQDLPHLVNRNAGAYRSAEKVSIVLYSKQSVKSIRTSGRDYRFWEAIFIIVMKTGH